MKGRQLASTILYQAREVRDAVIKSGMERGEAESHDKLTELLAPTLAGARQETIQMTRLY